MDLFKRDEKCDEKQNGEYVPTIAMLSDQTEKFFVKAIEQF